MRINPRRSPFHSRISHHTATGVTDNRFVAAARYGVESLEKRLLFAATVSSQPVTAVEGAAAFTIEVDYSSTAPIDTTTLGDDNIVVTGPNNYTNTPTFVSETTNSDGSVAADYSLAAPGNILSTTANGTYTVTVQAFNASFPGTGVADVEGSPIPAGVAGTFDLQVQPAPLLELSNPVFNAGDYAAGSTIPFRATVTNDGQGTAAPFTLSVGITSVANSFTDVARITPDDISQVLGTTNVDQSLAPGQSVVVNVNAVIPADETPEAYVLSAQINFGVAGAFHNSNDSFTGPTPILVAAPTPAPTPLKVGGLNPSFGSNGVVIQSTPLITTNAVEVQADGKTVAVGQTQGNNGTIDFGVTRFNTDGSLDDSFNGDGTATTDFNGGNDKPIAVSIQPNGQIVVLGTTFNASDPTQSSFALARYNTDGSVDTTFGNAGTVVTSFAASGATSSDVAQSMTISPSGLIAVCGRSDAGQASGNSDFAIAVYNANGTLDTAFGGTGTVLTGFLGGNNTAYDIGFDPRNGDVVAVGQATNPSTGQVQFAAVRYLPDGILDPKFGIGGKVLVSINGSDDEAYGVAVSAKGYIVATGGSSVTSGGTTTSDPATIELTPSGVLYKKFGVGGIATASLGQPGVANEVQINPGGGVLIAGSTTPSASSIDPSDLEVDVVQYTANGRPDPNFNSGTPLVLNLSSTTPALAHAFAPSDSVSQGTMQLLAQQHAIAQAVGSLIVVANTSSGTTAVAEVVSSGADLNDTLKTTFAALVPDDAKGTALVTVVNSGNQVALGTVAITVYASLDTSPTLIGNGAVQLAELPAAGLKLKASGSKVYKLKFSLPPTLPDGNYFLLANVDASASAMNVNAANDVVASAAPIQVENPFAGLSGPALTTPTGLAAGAKDTLPVTLQNTGGLPIKGTIMLQALAGADVTPAAGDQTLADTKLKLSLAPHASRVFPVKLVLPTTGAYYLLVVLTPPPSANGSVSTDILAGITQLVN